MQNELTKIYYKISEVSEIMGIPATTLRFWEKEFPELSPKRNSTNRRTYTKRDIEELQIIKFLIKDKGLKIEAARNEFRTNRKNISRRLEIIDRLEKVKSELETLLSTLGKRSEV